MRLSGHALVHGFGLLNVYTLLLLNALFFALYTVVILVNARAIGESRGASWFAGANLCRGGAMLVAAVGGSLSMPPRAFQAAINLLAAVGVTMLYRSFSELLERGPLLRWLQYTLLTATVVGVLYVVFVSSPYPVFLVLISVILGVQMAVTASVLFRFSGEDFGLAGRLTGLALTLYALIQLMRAMVTLRYNTPGYLEEAAFMDRVWLLGCLVSSSVTAFGFMFLSAAKFRIELMWRAQVDELTGLLNRWALKKIAMREIARCQRVKGSIAVMMMDVDGLKAVNDERGHGCGDVVLQTIASVLHETVRSQDFVGRMGGDEFCVLLPDTELEVAVLVAERLRSEVHDLVIRYRGDTVQVRASLGVTSSERCGLSWQNLMDQGDAALYQAKHEGKDRVVVAGCEEIEGDHPGAVKAVRVVGERRKR